MTHGPNTRAGGWPPPSPRRRPRHLRADLRLVGRSIEELCAQRLVAGAVGLGVALAPGSLAWAGELGLPAGAWLAMGVLGAVVR